MPEYAVQPGDCVESIAAEHGFNWRILWESAENTALRQLRKDPNVLLPGDVVVIPDKAARWEDCGTEKRHRFVRKGVPSKLLLILKDFDQPRANQRYVLEVDGRIMTGETDDQGRVEAIISPEARTGRLVVGAGEAQEEYVLELGHIDPIKEITGIEARLLNLGYQSLAEFQKKHRLEATGEPDEATLTKLHADYGC